MFVLFFTLFFFLYIIIPKWLEMAQYEFNDLKNTMKSTKNWKKCGWFINTFLPFKNLSEYWKSERNLWLCIYNSSKFILLFNYYYWIWNAKTISLPMHQTDWITNLTLILTNDRKKEMYFGKFYKLSVAIEGWHKGV